MFAWDPEHFMMVLRSREMGLDGKFATRASSLNREMRREVEVEVDGVPLLVCFLLNPWMVVGVGGRCRRCMRQENRHEGSRWGRTVCACLETRPVLCVDDPFHCS